MIGRLPRLKWHMLRRRRSDPPHLRANLAVGLDADASLEVDVVVTGDGHFACLHDLTLDRETTGTGPVAAASRAELTQLRQRDPAGAVLDSAPLFLDEVVAALARRERPFLGIIQLDMKEPGERLGDALVGQLRETLGAHLGAFIVSGTDPDLVRRIGAAMPGAARGFDPLDVYAGNPPTTAAEFEGLAETTLRLGPGARTYYLEANLILSGLEHGVNLVERIGTSGAEVDAWTVDANRPGLREKLDRLIGVGCRQITTNDSETLEAMLRVSA